MKIIRDIKPEFIDERGGITRVLDDKDFTVHSVLWITSKEGTIIIWKANEVYDKSCFRIAETIR